MTALIVLSVAGIAMAMVRLSEHQLSRMEAGVRAGDETPPELDQEVLVNVRNLALASRRWGKCSRSFH